MFNAKSGHKHTQLGLYRTLNSNISSNYGESFRVCGAQTGKSQFKSHESECCIRAKKLNPLIKKKKDGVHIYEG